MATPTTGLCQPLCVGRPEGTMGTGRPGGLRRLRAQALLADGRCQGFGGDRVSAASSCPKPLCCFPEGPNYNLFAEPGPWEIPRR